MLEVYEISVIKTKCDMKKHTNEKWILYWICFFLRIPDFQTDTTE